MLGKSLEGENVRVRDKIAVKHSRFVIALAPQKVIDKNIFMCVRVVLSHVFAA